MTDPAFYERPWQKVREEKRTKIADILEILEYQGGLSENAYMMNQLKILRDLIDEIS